MKGNWVAETVGGSCCGFGSSHLRPIRCTPRPRVCLSLVGSVRRSDLRFQEMQMRTTQQTNRLRSTPHPSKDARRRCCIRCLVISIKYGMLFSAVLLWSYQIIFKNLRPSIPPSPSSPIDAIASEIGLTSALSPLLSNSVPIISSIFDAQEDEAEFIINRSFQRTYAHILPCDVDTIGLRCIQKTIDFFKPRKRSAVTMPPLSIATEGGANSESDAIDDNVGGNDDDTSITVQDETDTTTLPPSIPWWFQTLLRDLPKNGAYGWWQTLTTANPPLQFCSIAKNGSTEWHEVFCRLNGSEKICKENGIMHEDECLLNCDNFQAPEGTLPSNVPRVVFIRDPLERLLSSYLNKCQDESHRNEEGHCEPNIIFRDRLMNHREGTDAIEPLLKDIEDNSKQLFAAYLDIMPLKWNLHVTPQAFACDLYRNIHQYNFVGKMDSQFMMDIDRMASHFGGGELAVALNKAFDYQRLVQKDGSKHVNFGTHSADGTRAPKKVNKFYTAQTVRKALEYVSIDYVLLGLSVPSWAKQMLREDYM